MVLSLKRWEGKIAVVTGASSGIGAAVSHILLKNGINVVGLARRFETTQASANPNKTEFFALKTDISKEQEILSAFDWIRKKLGSIHILINCAGISIEGCLHDGNTETWKSVLDVNVLGLCIATREALKVMKADNIEGHIIHINSILGHSVNNVCNVNVYPASKFAVTALTETLRQELISLKSKIKITSISPGLVASEMTTFNKNISEEKKLYFESRPSLDAEDVADAVVYALSTPEHVQIYELTIKPLGEPC